MHASWYERVLLPYLLDLSCGVKPISRQRQKILPLAERMPVSDGSFDTVVCTYSLCTISDPVAALREMRRALKPGGKLLFSEHGRAPDEQVRRWQIRLQPLWQRMAGGCQLARDIPALLQEGGFRPEVQSRYIPGPRFLSYHYWGEAVAD